MNVACLIIPRFVVHVEWHRQPAIRGRPTVVVEPGPNGRTVCAASTEAGEVTTGMSLAQALSHCPEAAVLSAEPPRYREAWNRILDRLEMLSPAVTDGGLGWAYLDIDQLASFAGGQDQLARALLSVVPSDWGPRLGLASSPFPAYLVATEAGPGQWSPAPEDIAAYLAPFPVDVLPLSRRIVGYLHSFGLHTLGQIAALPLGSLQAQFGPLGRLAWDLANGDDRRPLVPRRLPTTVRETMSFLAPATTTAALLVAVENLLGRAFGRPELRGRCARLAVLEGEIAGALPFVKRITFKEPVAGKDPAFRILKHLLADLHLPGPIEALSLALSEIGGEAGRQGSLFGDIRRRDNLRETMQELRARFAGRVPIYQIREVEPWSRIPERRRILVPYDP